MLFKYVAGCKSTLLSMCVAKWQTALCKISHFTGQIGNVRAKNAFATLIQIGQRDVNFTMRFWGYHFNARGGVNFYGRVCTCSLYSSVVNVRYNAAHNLFSHGFNQFYIFPCFLHLICSLEELNWFLIFFKKSSFLSLLRYFTVIRNLFPKYSMCTVTHKS